MHILALLVLIFMVAIVFSIGLEVLFKGIGCLILVALVLLVALPIGRLIIFSHPLGPVVVLVFIVLIVGRVLLKLGD